MNAEEIRQVTIGTNVQGWPDDKAAKYVNLLLRELTAQVAEAVEQLRVLNEPVEQSKQKWVWLTYRETPFVIDANEVTGVAQGNHLDYGTHVTPVCIIGMKGQPWSKSADGTVADVCAKLGITVEG